MRPLSQDLRRRIILAREGGAGTGEVCRRFGVSRKSGERFWQQPRLTGECQSKKIGGYRRSRLEKHDRTLRRWIRAQSDVTLSELQRRCLGQLKVALGITALWHRLEQLGWSYKKTTRAAEQDRPDVKAARKLWRRQQPGWDVSRLVFIDETGLNPKMARIHGRCPVGQRCANAIPHGHWQSSTFIAALRHERVEAPFLIEDPVDAEVFTVYLEQGLCPQLRAGDTLILDNLSIHKIQNVSRLLSARGVGVRYLPPYSPDLNPIERAFAKLKAHLRPAAARTLDDLHCALASALESFSPQHCRSFFHHAHYASF